MRTIAMVNQYIPQYRVAAWEGLRASLAARGVRMRLLHGRPHRSFAPRGDTVTLDWAEQVPMRELRLGGKDLVYLVLGDLMRTTDLVITNQEVRLLHNFSLLGAQLRGRGRLALMGHGRDSLKQGRRSPSEGLKLWMSRRVHWWFAYNGLSARQVEAFGYPASRITVFMNSTDTRALREAAAAISESDLAELRRSLGLGTGPHAVYVGGIDPMKRIDYLLEGARRVRSRIPSFELLLVGGGSEREAFRASTAGERWIHWIAPRFGRDKVGYMRLADLSLLPAGVGLGIVDSFALGVPLVTTDRFPHGVEIDYLEHGVNGWMCQGRPPAHAFGDAVADLLQDPTRLAALRAGALDAGARLSIESMVGRFTAGILEALDAPPRA